MKHRDVVRDGVICYLGVQVAAVGMQVLPPRCGPGIIGTGFEISISVIPPCGMWPELDLDESGAVPMINSLVASSTSTST